MDSLRKFPQASKSHSITLSIDHTTNARQEMENLKRKGTRSVKRLPQSGATLKNHLHGLHLILSLN